MVDHQLAAPAGFNEALQRVYGATDLQSALVAVEDAVRNLGFDRFALVDRYGPLGIRAIYHNAPPAWRAAQEDIARIDQDPAMVESMESVMPFAWDRAFYEERHCLEAWQDLAAHGYECGICASWGATDGRLAVLLTGRQSALPADRNLLYMLLADASLLAGACTDALTRVATTIKLRPREVECLGWAGKGKTAWETGQILGITERTVNQHLGRAMAELGVSKKEVAAILADRLGLLPHERSA